MTTDDLAAMMVRRFDVLEGKMATKDDLKNLEIKLEFKMEDVERKLSKKIDVVEEKVDLLEEIDIRDVQHRLATAEEDIKQIKQKHV